jgi:Fe2+ transport system protein FeoA
MRCPRCGYEAVPPSPLLDRLRRIFLRNPRPPAPALKPSPSLVDLAVGDEARVSGLAYDGTSHDAARLVAMGVLPGASVRLLRRSPAFVFQLGNSQFAIDEQIANRILIRSPELENTR